jgi:D-arabinose 1-dehydrogenase-like Zn-dependent alcohol dehydrogenase
MQKSADMVLGHEGVGVVEAVGTEVKQLKKGDRVGWGYVTNSCGHCLDCLQGCETFCPKRELYGGANFDQGSFASHAIWSEGFLHSIPEGLSDEAAAPLVCGENNLTLAWPRTTLRH